MKKARVKLRSKAQVRHGQRGCLDVPAATEHEMARLLSELDVHQAELEIQNEELRVARADVESGLARYTELFDFAPIGYVVLGENGTIQDINHAGAYILGAERGRFSGRRFLDLIELSHREVFRQMLGRTFDSEARETCVVQLSDQCSKTLQLSAAVLAHGAYERMILLAFEDISARIEQEAKLAGTERALREADRRKDEFLAVLSHELRNPLAPIGNSLYVLSHAEPGSQRSQNAVSVIRRQVSHLTSLVDDLLDVTRIAHGKVQLHRERLDLREVVRSTMDDQCAAFEALGIRMEARFDAAHFWVNADPARMVQVLSNLLNNAQKFTPRGGVVEVSLSCVGNRAELRVRDNGVGIPADVASHLFEPFMQAPQTLDRSRGGLGLGLAMTKGLVELHGGTISLASEGLDRGTTVTVSLPLEPAFESPDSAFQSRLARGRRVLVIEDNQDAADSLRDALAVSGHEVETAYDGPSGLDLARRLRPEVVVCDIGLPLMDGYEVAKALRADDALRGVYLVALTGYAMPEDLERAFAAGFDQHVAKPRPVEKLSRLLSDAPETREPSSPFN